MDSLSPVFTESPWTPACHHTLRLNKWLPFSSPSFHLLHRAWGWHITASQSKVAARKFGPEMLGSRWNKSPCILRSFYQPKWRLKSPEYRDVSPTSSSQLFQIQPLLSQNFREKKKSFAFFFCFIFSVLSSTLDPNPLQLTLRKTKTMDPFWKFNLFQKIIQNTRAKILPWVEGESLCREFL